MGNSLSLSGSKGITGKELQLSSKEITVMSNELFRFMYSTWKPKDVWDIAEHPDKYVIAISDMITTQFHVLGYKTRDKRMGEIYFRKWDDLEPPMGSEMEMAAANSRNDKSITNIRDEVVAKKLRRELSDRKKTRRQRAQAGFAIQKQNAEIIAFYFVRIFQILGAMLLVVKDIELPAYDENTGELKDTMSVSQERNFARQLYPSQLGIPSFKSNPSINDKKKIEYLESSARLAQEQRTAVEAQMKQIQDKKTGAKEMEVQRNKTGIQAGGGNFDTKLALGPYEFLRFYLRNISESDRLDFKNNGITDPGPNVYMLDKSRLLFFRYTAPTNNPDRINIVNGGKQEFGMPVKENGKVDIKFIRITIEKLRFISKGNVETEIKEYVAPTLRKESKKDVYPTDVTISYERVKGERGSSVSMTRLDTTTSVDFGIPYSLVEAENNLIDAYRGKLDPRVDFVEYLEMITLTYLRRKYSDITLIQLKTKSNTAENDVTEDTQGYTKTSLKEPSNKSLKEVFNALNTKNEYRPHCVARALQLLDPASINNFPTGSGTSRVCSMVLGKSSATTSLADYVPTRSLGQLYGKVNPTDYTNSMKVLEAFAKKDSTGNPVSLDDASKFPGEKDELLAAIQRLTKAFNGSYKDEKNFADIKSVRPQECTTDKDEIKIDRNSGVFRDMKASSQQLLFYHLKSIVEISKFLKKIFNITQRGDGTWAVEGPKVELLFAGYETLDKLTNQARIILIDYYAGCEEIYQKGLSKWKDSRADKVAVDASKPKEPVIGAILPSANKPIVVPQDPSVKPVPVASKV